MENLVSNKTGNKKITLKNKGVSGIINNPTITPLHRDGTCILKFRLSTNQFNVNTQNILNGEIRLWIGDKGATFGGTGYLKLELDEKDVIWTDGGYYEINRVFKINNKGEYLSQLNNFSTEVQAKIRVKADAYNVTYGVNEVVSEIFYFTYHYFPNFTMYTSLPMTGGQTEIRKNMYLSPYTLNSVGMIIVKLGYDTDQHYNNWRGRGTFSPYLVINYTATDGTDAIAVTNTFYRYQVLKSVVAIKAYTRNISYASSFVYVDQTPIGDSDMQCGYECMIDDSNQVIVFKTQDALKGTGANLNWDTDIKEGTSVTIDLISDWQDVN